MFVCVCVCVYVCVCVCMDLRGEKGEQGGPENFAKKLYEFLNHRYSMK